MDNYNDNDREYIEKDVIRPMASNLEERLKEEGLGTNIRYLKNNLFFYDILFDELCNRIIDVGNYARSSSEGFADQIKEHLYESKEDDKDRIEYDDDFGREELSEYEFDPLRIMNDISRFIERKVENSQKK